MDVPSFIAHLLPTSTYVFYFIRRSVSFSLPFYPGSSAAINSDASLFTRTKSLLDSEIGDGPGDASRYCL